MKRFLIYCAAAAMLASCGSSDGASKVGKASDDEIVAMANAAAERIANSDRNDTLAIQSAIMEARAERSTFAITGNNKAAEAYDEALHNKLTELDKALCDTLFPQKQQ